MSEILDRLKNATRKNSPFLAVVDEVDALVKRSEDDSRLYELTRINEDLDDGWIGFSESF